MFVSLLQTDPEFYLKWVILVMFSICVHEYCHAWTAWHQGDATAAENGYLTINPLIVMGPTSLLLLALFGIAWGAVPVNISRFRRTYSRAVVSGSGPAANAALFFVFFIAYIGARVAGLDLMASIPRTGMLANGFLFMFNLLPVPGLDGWDVFELFIPPMRRVPHETRTRAGWIILMVILFTGAYQVFWDASGWLTNGLIALIG